jgi:hypothetical protein
MKSIPKFLNALIAISVNPVNPVKVVLPLRLCGECLPLFRTPDCRRPVAFFLDV